MTKLGFFYFVQMVKQYIKRRPAWMFEIVAYPDAHKDEGVSNRGNV